MPLTTATAISVGPFSVWDEGTEETPPGEGSGQAVRTLLVNWGDRFGVVAYLLGGVVAVGGTTIYTAPQLYPDFTAWKALSIGPFESVGIPSVGPNGMIAFEWARMKVTYGRAKSDSSGGAGTANAQIDYGSMGLPLSQDDATFKWTSGTNNGDDIPPTLIQSVNLTVVSYQVSRQNLPTLPDTLVASLVDKSNDSTFLGRDAETVVFRGGKTRAKLTATGGEAVDSDYLFDYYWWGANKLVDGANGFQSYAYKSGSAKPHPTANLNQLLT